MSDDRKIEHLDVDEIDVEASRRAWAEVARETGVRSTVDTSALSPVDYSLPVTQETIGLWMQAATSYLQTDEARSNRVVTTARAFSTNDLPESPEPIIVHGRITDVRFSRTEDIVRVSCPQPKNAGGPQVFLVQQTGPVSESTTEARFQTRLGVRPQAKSKRTSRSSAMKVTFQ